MKTGDLQFGDYFYAPSCNKNTIGTVWSLAWRFDNRMAVMLQGKNFRIAFDIEKIKPIKLTADILSRNFRKCEDVNGIHYLFSRTRGCHSQYVGIYEGNNCWLIDAHSGDVRSCYNQVQIKVKYVHELQHALRLAKINKEIEL